MKTLKLINKAETFMSMKTSAQRKRADSLKEILGKLKKKKISLKKKLKTESRRDKRERIERDLAVIQAQRKKGLKALKDL